MLLLELASWKVKLLSMRILDVYLYFFNWKSETGTVTCLLMLNFRSLLLQDK